MRQREEVVVLRRWSELKVNNKVIKTKTRSRPRQEQAVGPLKSPWRAARGKRQEAKGQTRAVLGVVV